jgi:membrane protease YdiL (CAAX protease family)
MSTATRSGIFFSLLALPFMLNDFAFAALRGSYNIYLLDYAVRIAVITAVCTWPAARVLANERRCPKHAFLSALLAAVLLPLTQLPGEPLDAYIDGLTGLAGWFRFPPISDPVAYWFDLSAGLLLVALSEELVFRKLARKWLEDLGVGALGTVVLSALIFGMVHWGGGAGQVIVAGLIGAAYMLVYQRFNRLWPLVIAHWIQNFIAFGPF